MVNDSHWPWAVDTLEEKAEVFTTQIIGLPCRAWETLRVQRVVAILFIDAPSGLVNRGIVTRSEKKSANSLGYIGLVYADQIGLVDADQQEEKRGESLQLLKQARIIYQIHGVETKESKRVEQRIEQLITTSKLRYLYAVPMAQEIDELPRNKETALWCSPDQPA